MLQPLVLLIIGLIILVKGSDYFIEGAAFWAKHFGVSDLIIGLTLVAMGTSLPELGVSAYAAYTGSGLLAVGNVVGSNIANIALILGLVLLFRNLELDEKMYKRDAYFMLAISIIFAVMAFMDGSISRLEGIILMAIFVAYMALLFSRRQVGMEEGHQQVKSDGLLNESIKLGAGAIGVFIGSRLLVNSAIEIASILGVSEGAIGSTLVAFGTSLPELAVSFTALKKGYTPISIGNIIGSNIFNILWVLGIASIIAPLNANDVLLKINVPIMLAVASLLLIFMRLKPLLDRREGAVFIGIYLLFIVANFWG